jgi:hypothetical protein
MHHFLKLWGTNYYFKWVEVPGTTPYWKVWSLQHLKVPMFILSYIMSKIW